MKKEDAPYARFQQRELILRDELAVDRTRLANERTLLAYLRSAVALLIGGVTIMHFVEAGWFRNIGIACLPVGLITAAIGIYRFRRVEQTIRVIRSNSKP